MSRRPIYLVAAATLTTLALAACSSGDGGGDDPTDGGDTAGGDWETVTIEHALGTTEITEAPENIVTLGWGSTEAALALGVVPVGIEAQTYAVNDEGLLPWVAENLDEQGASPTIIPATVEEPAYEDIDDLNPDLILAPYSGITQEQYDLLSEIAPTVAYPDAPWTTPWRELITIVGESLGLDDEAAAVISDLDAEVAAVAQAHPELEGITVAAIWDIGGTFYVYKPADSRVDFLLDLGLVSAPSVDALDSGGEAFVYSLSYEQTDQLDAQLIVNYASTEAEVETFLAQSYAQAIPAVQAGAIANITGDALIAAMSPPTALSLTWGLEDYATTISEAAANVQ